MPVYTAINPTSDISNSGALTGAASATLCLNDGAFDATTDSTYVAYTSGQQSSLNFGSTGAVTAGELVLGWQCQIRGSGLASSVIVSNGFGIGDPISAALALITTNTTTRIQQFNSSGNISTGGTYTPPGGYQITWGASAPRVYKVALSLVTAAKPVVTITSPVTSGTVRTSTVPVTWTYTQSDGYAQGGYQLQVLSGSTVVYDGGFVTGNATTATVPAGILTAGTAYTFNLYAWATIPTNWTTYTLGSTVVSSTSVTYQPPAPIAPTLTVAAASDNSATLTIKGSVNLLSDSDSDFTAGSANQPTVGTTATSFGNWTCTSGTVSQDSTQFLTNATSFKYVSTTTGTVTFTHPQFFPASNAYPFGFVLNTKHTTAARLCTLTIAWYQADKVTSAGASTTATLTPGSTAAWFSQVCTNATPPAGTAYAKVSWTVASTSADVYYFDALMVGPGIASAITIATLSGWVPGNPQTGLATQYQTFYNGCTYDIQRSSDGGVTWQSLNSVGFLNPSPAPLPQDTSSVSTVTFYDQSCLSAVPYQYRARTNQPISGGTVTSPWTTGVAYTPATEAQWRLRPVNATYAGTSVSTAVDVTAWADGNLTELVQEFSPIGSSVVVTLTPQTFQRHGTTTFHAFGTTAQTNLTALMYVTAPMWIISPYGEAQCVKMIQRDRQVQGPATAPHHFWNTTWVEVA